MQASVTCAALRDLLAGRAEVVLLDVRRQPAFAADPRLIPGAAWQDPDQVWTWAADLRPDLPVIAYCVHGHEVSRWVVERLRGFGIKAALLEGGFEPWKACGEPVVRPDRQQAG
jgi:superoxide dismutase, Fe-Mn family